MSMTTSPPAAESRAESNAGPSVAPSGDPGRIRTAIVQLSLPKYRLPVFQELARRPGIDLELVFSRYGNIPNVEPAGFKGTFKEHQSVSVRGRELIWHGKADLRWARKKKCDVIVLPWHTGCLSLVPAMVRARSQGVGIVLWGHGFSKQDSPKRQAARRKVAQLANSVMFYNTIARDAFAAGEREPSRLFVALNTIDMTDKFEARRAWLDEPGRLMAFRKSEGLEGNALVLFVSRLQPENRVDVLIHAAAELRKSVPNLRVAIVGHGPEEQKLKALAVDQGVSDIVRFTGAIYDEMKIAPWFLCADVYCYPANIGLSILHAFAYGVPVVTSDNLAGQNPEIEAMEHENNGLLYKDLDVPSLSTTLLRVINDRELRSRLSARATRTAAEKFTIRNMVDGMEAAIRHAARAVKT
ncbi:MAG: glycosyltransferase family 4 protein [Planctomycetota bacterium]|nr:glycosyltransferase family 4 protein [Planctomycetota bacterium]